MFEWVSLRGQLLHRVAFRVMGPHLLHLRLSVHHPLLLLSLLLLILLLAAVGGLFFILLVIEPAAVLALHLVHAAVVEVVAELDHVPEHVVRPGQLSPFDLLLKHHLCLLGFPQTQLQGALYVLTHLCLPVLVLLLSVPEGPAGLGKEVLLHLGVPEELQLLLPVEFLRDPERGFSGVDVPEGPHEILDLFLVLHAVGEATALTIPPHCQLANQVVEDPVGQLRRVGALGQFEPQQGRVAEVKQVGQGAVGNLL